MSNEDQNNRREFVLAALRAAALRAKAMEADLNTIGIALKGNLIPPETAVKWVRDADLSFLVFDIPEPTGKIEKNG